MSANGIAGDIPVNCQLCGHEWLQCTCHRQAFTYNTYTPNKLKYTDILDAMRSCMWRARGDQETDVEDIINQSFVEMMKNKEL